MDKSMFRAKTFQTRKNFPGSNAPALPTYFCLCVKVTVCIVKCALCSHCIMLYLMDIVK